MIWYFTTHTINCVRHSRVLGMYNFGSRLPSSSRKVESHKKFWKKFSQIRPSWQACSAFWKGQWAFILSLHQDRKVEKNNLTSMFPTPIGKIPSLWDLWYYWLWLQESCHWLSILAAVFQCLEKTIRVSWYIKMLIIKNNRPELNTYQFYRFFYPMISGTVSGLLCTTTFFYQDFLGPYLLLKKVADRIEWLWSFKHKDKK